jgi:cytoskeletal protein RodZ
VSPRVSAARERSCGSGCPHDVGHHPAACRLAVKRALPVADIFGMATHVALAGLSLSSMSGRLLLLAVLLALVGVLLLKRMRDARAAADTDVDSDVEPSGDEIGVEHVDPRSLVSQVSASPVAPVAPVAATAATAPAAAPAALAAPVADVAPARAQSASAVATAERAAAPEPVQAAPVAATRPTPPPAAPARPARTTGLFAPVPDSAIAAGGRAPGATIVPKF